MYALLTLQASRRPCLVRETSPLYEGEGSERRTLGSVSVTPNSQWMATLTVPIPSDRWCSSRSSGAARSPPATAEVWRPPTSPFQWARSAPSSPS